MATEWHKIEFLSAGQRRKDATGTETVEYHPAESLGHGYYEVVDGIVTRHLDEQGKELDMTRVHECRVVGIVKSSPFASA